MPHEGRAMVEHRTLGLIAAYPQFGPGQTRCQCGEWSPELPTTAARKRWHREHKQQVAQST